MPRLEYKDQDIISVLREQGYFSLAYPNLELEYVIGHLIETGLLDVGILTPIEIEYTIKSLQFIEVNLRQNDEFSDLAVAAAMKLICFLIGLVTVRRFSAIGILGALQLLTGKHISAVSQPETDLWAPAP